jgi:predicted NodU family carbamoyl transferase
MKDGYYLSAYIELDDKNEFPHRHDQSIALWKKTNNQISLEDYWELERFTAKKLSQMLFFDSSQFKLIMNEFLDKHNLNYTDIIEIWSVPQLTDNDHYLSKYKFPDVTYHAICHLSSSLFMDMDKFRNEKILAFAVDRGSDIVMTNDALNKNPFIGCWSDPDLNELQVYPVYSPGFLWDCMRHHFDIDENTLMELAAASKSESYIVTDDILVGNNIKTEAEKFEQVMLLIKEVEDFKVSDAGIKFNYFDPKFSISDNKISMIMKTVQKMSQRIMKRNIDEAIRKYNIKPQESYLAMSGGYALNCPCNSYLLDVYGFKGLIAPPCVSDSGLALGIGLYSFYNELGSAFEFKLKNAYYGDEDDLEAFLGKGEFQDFIESVTDFDENKAVTDIEAGPIVWFNGRAGIGPKALGSRSIIGDPRKKQTKDILNKIKLRQWWRPVALIVLKDREHDWFEKTYDSPYMLHSVKIREEKENQVPAIVQEDKTSRVQTIDEESETGLLLTLVRAFADKTGVPILCNTSLNDKGNPIINRIEEAVSFALRKGIKVAYFNGNRVLLKNHDKYEESSPVSQS